MGAYRAMRPLRNPLAVTVVQAGGYAATGMTASIAATSWASFTGLVR
jgi:hypothetical protein